jgi:hypothetical protein
MITQAKGLISVLLDRTAREDERHDATMDLSKYPMNSVLTALLKVANDSTEEDIILNACGESIAEIWVHRGEIQPDKICKLAQSPFLRARSYIKCNKHEWIKYFEIK